MMSDHHSAKTQGSTYALEHFNVQTVVQNQRSEANYYMAYPNRWAYIRNEYLRDFASELLGKHVHTLSDVDVDRSAFIVSAGSFQVP